jgi:hypothetical protein
LIEPRSDTLFAPIEHDEAATDRPELAVIGGAVLGFAQRHDPPVTATRAGLERVGDHS